MISLNMSDSVKKKLIGFNLFLQGHEDRFSVYVHSSKEKPVHVSPYFAGRDIRSDKVMELSYCIYSILLSQSDTSPMSSGSVIS